MIDEGNLGHHFFLQNKMHFMLWNQKSNIKNGDWMQYVQKILKQEKRNEKRRFGIINEKKKIEIFHTWLNVFIKKECHRKLFIHCL